MAHGSRVPGRGLGPPPPHPTHPPPGGIPALENKKVVWFPGFLVSKFLGFLSFLFSLFLGFLVSWLLGSLVPWFLRFLVSWFQSFKIIYLMFCWKILIPYYPIPIHVFWKMWTPYYQIAIAYFWLISLIYSRFSKHFKFFGRYWSHIPDFQIILRRIFMIVRCLSFPTISNMSGTYCTS